MAHGQQSARLGRLGLDNPGEDARQCPSVLPASCPCTHVLRIVVVAILGGGQTGFPTKGTRSTRQPVEAIQRRPGKGCEESQSERQMEDAGVGAV